ncbi:MAG: histidinol dehydrogenase [Proteobacteria bacterium]|nr:histidinol dehydrogenase [Pseudomonadota bacterium]
MTVAAAYLSGADVFLAVGGAQSIAAMAYGTDSIAPVCVITGPGNRFVAEAKRQVFGKVGIDSIAGPSEILILHDDPTVPVEYLVRDMISQAEHDESAQSILITTSSKIAEDVRNRLDELVPSLPRKEIIEASLKNNGKIIVVDKIEEGIEISNRIAPEHLELLLTDENQIEQIRNAGAIFVGRWSSEPVGDYFAGPNHTIPTNGSARYASPLSVRDFQKQSSLIHYSKKRLMDQGEEIATFADLEELNGHAEAIRERLRIKE